MRISECCDIDYVLVIFVSFNLIDNGQEAPGNSYSYCRKKCIYVFHINLPLVSTLSLCSLRSLDGGHYAREKCRVLLGAAGGLTTHIYIILYIYLFNLIGRELVLCGKIGMCSSNANSRV